LTAILAFNCLNELPDLLGMNKLVEPLVKFAEEPEFQSIAGFNGACPD
jgi:hypothetical protein